MANSRKDSRGYVLRTGESERKDGRYSYSYTDLERNRRTVYAKTLVELRKIERKIIRDKEDGLDPQLADRMTLNQLYDKYIENRKIKNRYFNYRRRYCRLLCGGYYRRTFRC